MSFTTQTQLNKSPFQNLDGISAIKEIFDEAAAIIQGGSAMTLYRHSSDDPAHPVNEVLGQFNGGGLRELSSNADNQASAVSITEGKWEFFSSSQWINVPLKNDTVVLGPGTWNFDGLNDKISSFKRVG